MTVIVSLGEPIGLLASIEDSRENSRRRLLDFAVAGLHTGATLIAADRPQEGLAIEMTPLGARVLLGLPAARLLNQTVEAEVLIGRSAESLRAGLHDASSWAERFALCDMAFLKMMRDSVAGDVHRLRRPWQLLVASGGTMEVSHLADEVGWSRRYLTRRFNTEFGLSPKAVGRLIRFERACDLLRANSRAALADVALACGYYDQSHLNRDFAALAGCSPTVWLGSEFPSVLDSRNDLHAASRHD